MASTHDLVKPSQIRAIPPALLALFLQITAWLPAILLIVVGLPLAVAILIQGMLALALSRWLDMPDWWQLINLLFSPLLWLFADSGIDPRWFLAGFLLLALTSFGSLWTRVPLYLSSQRAVEEIACRLPDRPGLRIIDLGSGLGGLLCGLANRRSDLKLYGVEMAPLNWLLSRIRLGRRARIRLGNLWQENLADYDLVYAYLSPAPMARLWSKVQYEMKPGSLFISNSFAVPGIDPDESVDLHDLNGSRLLIWRR